MTPIALGRRALFRHGLLLLGLTPLFGHADPIPSLQPILKIGACPSGYRASGQYCLPGDKARLAMEKRGSCPSGYTSRGAYCLAGRSARPAVPKWGTACPSGWSTSGDYCLRNRP